MDPPKQVSLKQPGVVSPACLPVRCQICFSLPVPAVRCLPLSPCMWMQDAVTYQMPAVSCGQRPEARCCGAGSGVVFLACSLCAGSGVVAPACVSPISALGCQMLRRCLRLVSPACLPVCARHWSDSPTTLAPARPKSYPEFRFAG